MHYNELVPAQAGDLLPLADRLRLAVAAYLARFKGASRDHANSDLRCHLAWCAERDLDPLLARRPHLELYIRWMQEIRRFKPSTVSGRLSVTAGFYRTCVIDGVLEPCRISSSSPVHFTRAAGTSPARANLMRPDAIRVPAVWFRSASPAGPVTSPTTPTRPLSSTSTQSGPASGTVSPAKVSCRSTVSPTRRSAPQQSCTQSGTHTGRSTTAKAYGQLSERSVMPRLGAS